MNMVFYSYSRIWLLNFGISVTFDVLEWFPLQW